MGEVQTLPRVIGWVSGGAASAVACKLAIAKYGPGRVVLAYKDTGAEDADTDRFLADLERWYVQFVRDDSDVILNSHPADVQPCHPQGGEG